MKRCARWVRGAFAAAVVCGVGIAEAVTENEPTDEYAKIAAIISTGHQYINTLYTPTGGETYEFDLSLLAGQDYIYAAIFGFRDVNNKPLTVQPYMGSRRATQLHYFVNGQNNSSIVGSQIPREVPLHLVAKTKSGECSVEWTDLATGSLSGRCASNGAPAAGVNCLLLFTWNISSSADAVTTDHSNDSGIRMRLADFKISLDGELRRHFIPVAKDIGLDTEEVGLWETVEGKFYANADPSVGPFLKAEYDEDKPDDPVPMPAGCYPAEYIESQTEGAAAGHQLIHTSYRYRTGDVITYRAMLTGAKSFPYSTMFGGKTTHYSFSFQPVYDSKETVVMLVGESSNDRRQANVALPKNEELKFSFLGAEFSVLNSRDESVLKLSELPLTPNSIGDLALFSYETAGGDAFVPDGFRGNAWDGWCGITMRLYDFEVRRVFYGEDGVELKTIAHFIPCCRNYDKQTQTGEFGLWEEIGGQFYGDANPCTTEAKGFLGGPVFLPKQGICIMFR